MRNWIQSGRLRWPITVLAGAGAWTALFCNWDSLSAGESNPLDAGQKIAFVAAAFSVTAYNLRTRVLDVILKSDGSPLQVSHLCSIARQCGRKLTDLVVVFTLTALLLGAGGFVTKTSTFAAWFGPTVAGFFAASVVQFVYVLFSFETLEKYALNEAEVKASQREAARLVGKAS